MANDSNLSRGASAAPLSGPIRQHHRLQTGEKVTGTSDPYGEKPNTASKVAGQKKTY